MQFTKMHGAGNDFIIINNILEKIKEEDFPHIALSLCKRRLSLGADGIMFVDKSTKDADFKMHFYNADGSQGEMCGNGARCICRYGYENGLAGLVQRVETISGVVEGERIDKRNYKVRLNRPSFFKEDYTLAINGKGYACSYVELGNPGLPHLVVELAGFKEMPEEDLFKLGKALRHHKNLDKGANVNFFYIDTDKNLYARTFERGVEDFTLACGTGAGSIGFTLIKKGRHKGKGVKINMPGGLILVELEKNNHTYEDIIITGPTNIVAQGIILDEDLI